MSRHLANWFKSNRLRKGLSTRDVKLALGVQYEGYIENIEAGRRKPPMEKVSTLCKLFDVRIETFVDAMVADFREEITSKVSTKKKPIEVEAKPITTDDFGGLL